MKLIDGDFESEVLDYTDGLVLVDFFAVWCGPCQQIVPALEELEKELAIKVVKVDVDKESDIREKYDIMSIPTLLLIKNGEVLSTFCGASSKEKIREWIESSSNGV